MLDQERLVHDLTKKIHTLCSESGATTQTIAIVAQLLLASVVAQCDTQVQDEMIRGLPEQIRQALRMLKSPATLKLLN